MQYEDSGELSVAGISHIENVTPTPSGGPAQFTRWRFFGTTTLTVVALSSLERDRLYDEVVRTFAFGRQNQSLASFRNKIETNDFIAMNVNFDDLRPFGDNAAPGTPWQTDEFIYEKSISMNLQGECVGDPNTQALVKLSKILVQDYVPGAQPVPTWPEGPMPAPASARFDPAQWH